MTKYRVFVFLLPQLFLGNDSTAYRAEQIKCDAAHFIDNLRVGFIL